MSLPPPQMPEAGLRSSCFPVLAGGSVHEFFAAHEADGAALAALVLILAQEGNEGLCLWVRHEAQVRENGMPSPPGLAELGINPAVMLLFRAHDAANALQAGLEGARCGALGAVIIELPGEAKAYDLVASRRLSMAAKASGTRVLLVRVAAPPMPSAAQTRWQVRAMPSRALVAKAPGPPAFELILLRARNGQEGLRYCVEWDRDARQFIPRSILDTALPARSAAPVSGAVVPVSFDRQSASPMPPRRQAG